MDARHLAAALTAVYVAIAAFRYGMHLGHILFGV